LTSAKCAALLHENSAGTMEIAIFNYTNSTWEQIKLVYIYFKQWTPKSFKGFGIQDNEEFLEELQCT